ncbi:MAG: phosphatidylserine decarboxylase [Phycisphaeraceae bacterium]|nr:phosphatidylserine decarboxylase [Phycisphaeraceae bacterium]
MHAPSTNPPSPDILADLPAPIIAREGWPIVAAFAIGSIILNILAVRFLGPWGSIPVAASLALTVWCIWFFRDPPRRLPTDPRAIISPADGVICAVGPASPPPELGVPAHIATRMTRISVFMNVFNVHVNRAPIAGTVRKISYRPGKFFNASLDKASEFNERCALWIEPRSSFLSARPDAAGNGGRSGEAGHGGGRGEGGVACVQIAGLIARRIVCRVKEGESLAAGQRFGLIRFGSRVDVYLPEGILPMVKKGDPSVAGETIFAVLPLPPFTDAPAADAPKEAAR